MSKFSNAEKAQELRRELGMRRHVYPRKVADGKMQQQAADRMIALAEDMLADYERLAAIDMPDMFAPPPPAAPPMREVREGGRPPARYEPRKAMQRRPERSIAQSMDDNRSDMGRLEESRDPTFGKTPGRNIERGSSFTTCKCGEKVLKGLVRDALSGTLHTRFWDAVPYTHTDGQNYYTKHRCVG